MNGKKILPLFLLPLLVCSCTPQEPSSIQESTSKDSSVSTSESSSSQDSTTVVIDDEYKATIHIDGSEEGTIYTPDEVEITETHHSLEEKRYYNTQVLPSTGDVNILVIPVLVPEYNTFSSARVDENATLEEKKEKVRQDIETAFFGTEGLGYESVSSFYRKSSYGKLNLTGTVTDWYDASLAGVTSAADLTINAMYTFVERAVEWAFTTQNLVSGDFDSDYDGFYDGVWLIYSAENYSNGGPMTDDMNYWAYTTWGNQDKRGANAPDPSRGIYYYNLFGWASYDFMYEAYDDAIDSHTYIHETGHFLGLNDYYSDRLMYNPVGKVDMMDANITDHNSYSKMLLGWTKPYIVTGDATIDLGSMEEENQVIVIPGDSYTGGNKFDPFSEYMVVELYTPTELNEADSISKLSSDRPLAPSTTGVRIYHVDNRKFVVDSDRNSTIYTEGELSTGETFIIPITNSITLDQYYTTLGVDISYYPYDEIRMIEKRGENTFSYGGFQRDISYFYEGDSFSIDNYSEFFINENVLDSGDSFGKTIEVISIQEGN